MQQVQNDQNGLLSSNEFRIIPKSLQRPNQSQNDQQNQINDNIEVTCCVFSPDQRYLAWSCGYGLVKLMKWKDEPKDTSNINSNENIDENSSSSNQEAESTNKNLSNQLKDEFKTLKNNQTKNQIIEIECAETVFSLAFGSTKSYLKHTQKSRRPQVYRRFNFNEDRLLLAIGLASGKIRIYDGASGRFLFVLFDHSDQVCNLKFTKDGTLQLASVSRDETIKLWNMYDDGNMYKTLKGHVGWVYACDWSPTAPMFCSVGRNRQAFIWDMENYTITHQLKGHLHDVVTCEFSPDGALIATGSYDTKICIWDPYTGNLIKQLYHLLPPPSFIYAGGYNGAYVRYLTFSANGDHLLSICDDKKIRVWSLCSKSSSPICEEWHRDGLSCAYSSNSRTIIIGTRNGQIDQYEVNVVIPRLVDICRKVVNQYTNRKLINELCLPLELKKFLKYEDLKDQTSPKPANVNISKINSNSNTTQFQTTVAF